MKRIIVVEFVDATSLVVRFAVRNEASTNAINVYFTVDLVNNKMGPGTVWRCAADPASSGCRVLGGNSSHVEVTGQYLAPALSAYGEAGDQEALFVYLEGVL